MANLSNFQTKHSSKSIPYFQKNCYETIIKRIINQLKNENKRALSFFNLSRDCIFDYYNMSFAKF